MGKGNHHYREELRGEGKGAFLTLASAMRLASRPLFNAFAGDASMHPQLEKCELTLSTNLTRADLVGARGALHLEGTVRSSLPVYGIIAYFDSRRGPQSSYEAPTATSVPDSQGRFAIELGGLEPCEGGEVRIELCHANGAILEKHLQYSIRPDRAVDVTQKDQELRDALKPIARAVNRNHLKAAEKALEQLERESNNERAKTIARKLTDTLRRGPKPKPAEAPADVLSLALGDALPDVSEVGWGSPAANRIPPNNEVDEPYLDSGTIYATGLYAHSPSRYVFDLGGKWGTLKGMAGLHASHQNRAVGVKFVIRGDGTELYRSELIRDASHPEYEVNVKNVKSLELIVERPSEGNAGNWGLWLEPTLFR